MSEITASHKVREYIGPEGSDEIPGVCNDSRVNFQKKQ